MTITIPKSQGGALLEGLNMAMLYLDGEINRLTLADHDGDEEAYEQASELINERERISRLHDIVLAEVGGTVTPFRICPDDDCGWPNPIDEKECENCGDRLPDAA